MRFFEYEAREIVKRAGIPVTEFGFATDGEQARAIAERIGAARGGSGSARSDEMRSPTVVKSQVQLSTFWPSINTSL